MEQFFRSSLIIGEGGTSYLQTKTVLICGIGGVGSYVVEALARMGIGHLILVDHDLISITNLNRQLFALHSTLGMQKTEVAKKRLLDINPHLKVDTFPVFIDTKTLDSLFENSIDYIVDAVDTVSAKLLLIEKAKALNIPIISSMGTGNKLDPSQLKIMDIEKTSYCPLAKVMRYELRKRKITHVKVLSSTEEPFPVEKIANEEQPNKMMIGSVSFVPSAGGLLIASEVIRDFLKESQKN